MSNIPIFPKFKKLELSDREWIESITSKFPPYSDFNFVSLWSYNVKDEAEVSTLYGNLVVMFHDYLTGEPFYTFIGLSEIDKTIEALLELSEAQRFKKQLKLIPECVVSKMNGSRKKYSVLEDFDSNDYIFDLENHARLRGRIFSDKRNLVNRFRKEHTDYEVKQIELTNEKVQSEIMALFNSWELNKKVTPTNTKHEKEAVRRLLQASNILNPLGIGIYIESKLAAFSISNIVHEKFAIGHFEKVDYTHNGLSAYIRQLVAEHLLKYGCVRINYEQDLGLAPLRNSKKHWNPIGYLKKYTIG